MIETGKLPPQAINIEEKIIAAILTSPNILDDIFDMISIESFYKESHQKIFKACVDIYKSGGNVDILTVTDHLTQNNEIDLVGGNFYIIELSSLFVPELIHNIESHCLILKQYQLQRYFISLSHKQMELAYGGADVSENLDLMNKAQEEISNILEYGNNVKSLNQNISLVIDLANERTKNVRSGNIVGVTTGLIALNKKLTFTADDLIVVASRPGMGKTAMCLKYAKEAAKQGKHVRIYSLEMSDISLTERILLSESDIPASKFRDGYMSNTELQSLEVSAGKLDDLNIWIDDKPARTASSILANAKKYHKKGECDEVIIDYLQLTEPESDFGSTNDKVGKITRTLKKGAKELKIPFILLSQLNRAVEQRPDKIPQLSDLRDSGNIEQDADKVMFLFRPEYYGMIEDTENGDLRGVGFCIIAKNRQGACGTVKFRYNESLTKIYDYDTVYEDLEEKHNPDKHIESNNNFDNEAPF